MKAVVQRVSRSEIRIKGKTHCRIAGGLLILLGVHESDTPDDAKSLAEKCAGLRIFEDNEGKMNLSVKDVDGSAMVVSQFTLYGDTRRGNRPNFMQAARPEPANQLYQKFVERLGGALGNGKVVTGVFREMMEVELVNDGPVTIIMETKEHD
ncbi:MAG TPA: D-aminoacyl-tRNA deacylase [Candidatus Kryptonia bacterium]